MSEPVHEPWRGGASDGTVACSPPAGNPRQGDLQFGWSAGIMEASSFGVVGQSWKNEPGLGWLGQPVAFVLALGARTIPPMPLP